MGKARLKADTVRGATQVEVEALKWENDRLKRRGFLDHAEARALLHHMSSEGVAQRVDAGIADAALRGCRLTPPWLWGI